jgi:hypothetical protein
MGLFLIALIGRPNFPVHFTRTLWTPKPASENPDLGGSTLMGNQSQDRILLMFSHNANFITYPKVY